MGSSEPFSTPLLTSPSPRLSAAEAGGANVVAFFDVLGYSEGTSRLGQNGYNVLVGGGTFDSYADHPRKLVYLPTYKINSSAAGRYQFLRATWDDLAKRLKLPDFSPRSQDLACIGLLRQCGAYDRLLRNLFSEAVERARTLWASLPGAGYGQREIALEKLRAVYVAAGGKDQP